MTAIKLTKISKRFNSLKAKTIDAVRDISLEIKSGEFLTIVGRSGCGKSTLLQLIADIEKPTSGTIDIVKDAGQDGKPRVGFIFQANTVFPWRTVEDNLSYALEVKGVGRAVRREESARLCELVGLQSTQYLSKYPKELSGGEVRRVAIGMALAYRPDVLLFDEATSQLDYVTRLAMQLVVQEIWLRNPFTAVYVTHDIEESVFLGDRVLLLERGVVKDLLKIDLERPRDKKVLDHPRFLGYRDQILNKLEE
jgi:ABC-type nitrate/sulfonate/bicarbonate transport system ATPase subunit